MQTNQTILIYTLVRVAVLIVAAGVGYSSITHEGELAQIVGAISAAIIAAMTWLSVQNQKALRDTNPNPNDDDDHTPPPAAA